MPKTVASVNISVLDFSVLLDMSAAIPTLKISNLSTMTNPTSLSWAFVVLSPFGTPIHEGVITAPDILAPTAFGTYTIAEPIPLIFGQLEFNASSAYSVKVIVKDAAGKIFDLTKSQAICKPNGNNGKNNFGAAIIEMESKCSRAQLYVVDKTNLLYKGIVGSKVSTEASVSYPKDESGFAPATVTVTSLPALLPMRSEGEGHNLYVAHKYDYNLGDNFVVRVRYSFKDTFAVWCSVNLCPLFCEVDKITEAIQKNCDIESKKEQNQKLQIINAKLLKAVVGTLQPLCGFDVPKIIEEIKVLGGFDCDCCSVRGISDVSNVLLANANLSVNKVCGDMLLSWSTDANGNVVLNYQNASYVFAVSEDPAASDALTVLPTTVGCVKTTTFHLNKSALAIEIVNEIKNSQTLITILQSLLNAGGSLVCSGINGYTIHTTGNFFVNLSTLDLTINQILINGITYPAPVNLLLTNTAGVTAWLNGLGKGTFVVNYDAPNSITSISSTANTNTVTSVGVGTNKTVSFTNSGGLICNILQSILTYLNGINLLQVKTGGEVTICKVVAGEVVLTVYPPETTAFVLVTKLAEAICANIALIAPPGGFAVTGNARSSGFGKMQYFATLALANTSAVAGETVLIYNDTTENLTAKNGVHYQGIGKHNIGKLIAANYIGSISNLVINMQDTTTQIFAAASKINLTNVEVKTTNADILITGASVIVGGDFNIVGTIIMSNTAEMLRGNVKGKVSLTDSAVLDWMKVLDISETVSGAAVNMQGVSPVSFPTVSNCKVISLNNQGIASIYSTRIVGNYAKSVSKEGIYVHGGQPTFENRIVCTRNTAESLTFYGMSVVSNNGLPITPNNLIDWQVSHNDCISRDFPGIFLIEGNIRKCSGYSVNAAGILVGGSDNPSSNVKVIDCVGESRNSHGLYAGRDIFIYGGTYISRSDNATTGSPIKLAHVPARSDAYHIVGVKTISVNATAYSIAVDAGTPAPVIARISGCDFTNPNLLTGVPGIDPAITLQAVAIDAYGNRK